MAHMKKFTRAAVGHMVSHYDREGHNIGNENINPARTPENYNLAPAWNIDQGEFIKQRCGEVRTLNRKDVNVMVSWVVTTPKSLPESDQRLFFRETYDFLKKRYGGEQNVVSAYVHMDEVTPHIHFAFVPVVADQKRGGFKLSAHEAVNRQDLRTFHEDLSQHMETVFGRDIGILNEATKEGNKSVNELKRGEVAKLSAEHELLAGDIESLKKQRNALEGEISVLDDVLKEKTGEGAAKFGGKESMQVRMAAATERAGEKNRLRLLEGFVALPMIAQLFKEYCQELGRGRSVQRDTRE
jgi:hypothetical protein